MDSIESAALTAVEAGSAEEAQVALARLMSVASASFERRAQLETALASRIVIEQAKGILAERLGMSVGDAFDVLRKSARSRQMKLRDLAQAVVASPDTPAPIAETLRRRGV